MQAPLSIDARRLVRWLAPAVAVAIALLLAAGPSSAQAAWCTGSRIANLPISDSGTLLGHLEIYYNSAGTNCAMTTSRGTRFDDIKKYMSVTLRSCRDYVDHGEPCDTEDQEVDSGYFYNYAGPVGVDGWRRCIYATGRIRYGGYDGRAATSRSLVGTHCG